MHISSSSPKRTYSRFSDCPIFLSKVGPSRGSSRTVMQVE
jgi:hypothetical protein